MKIFDNYALISLVLRLGFGFSMMTHGLDKFIGFAEKASDFPQVFGLSASISLGLAIFSELFCSILIVLGLFTRIAVIPLIITMLVAIFQIHFGDPFSSMEKAVLYLIGYLALAIAGSGSYSLDNLRQRSIK